MPVTGADNGLSLADFTGKAYNDPQWDALLDQLTLTPSAAAISSIIPRIRLWPENPVRQWYAVCSPSTSGQV